jgi:hypothetical protein
MATIESPERVGVKPFHEFDEARATWPRGDRFEELRAAAREFRGRFKEQGQVVAVRTIDLVTVGYPLRYALGGAATGVNPNPYISLTNRLVVVRFHDFEGAERTLAWEPTIPENSAEAPFYQNLVDRYGEWLAFNVFSTQYHTLAEALSLCGLSPADVDFAAFDHLHVQDLRPLMGTGEVESFFPNATFLHQRKEVDTFRSPHPMQWAWYVPGGMDGVREENQLLLDGDVELGVGVALMATPGHTDGNQSLVLNTPEGIWVSSENGVCADNWHPYLSRIPGVRKEAEAMGREVILNSNTLEDSIEQYDSMVQEKAVADAHSADARYMQVMPSSEMRGLRRQWPVKPTFTYGGINYGSFG